MTYGGANLPSTASPCPALLWAYSPLSLPLARGLNALFTACLRWKRKPTSMTLCSPPQPSGLHTSHKVKCWWGSGTITSFWGQDPAGTPAPQGTWQQPCSLCHRRQVFTTTWTKSSFYNSLFTTSKTTELQFWNLKIGCH